MQAVLKIDYTTVYLVMTFALILGAPFFIFWGWLSDRIGRRSIMTAGFALAVISYWPVFTWLGEFRDNPVILDRARLVHGDPGDHGVRADRGVPGRAVSGAHPLLVDVAALSHRQRRVRRRRAVHRDVPRDDVRRRAADRICSIR